MALPTRTAIIAADCIRRAQRQAIECGMEIDSMQQLPADFFAVSGASGVIRKDFAEWLDSPQNHEVALHLVRELIERYTTVHYEDVLGAAAGPRRAESGITHAADLLGEDGVKQTFGSQVRARIIGVPSIRNSRPNRLCCSFTERSCSCCGRWTRIWAGLSDSCGYIL